MSEETPLNDKNNAARNRQAGNKNTAVTNCVAAVLYAATFAWAIMFLVPRFRPEAIWPPDGPPCIRHSLPTPFLMGKTSSMHMGRMQVSDCVVTSLEDGHWKWSSPDTDIVKVSPEGSITAIGVGKFTLLATRGENVKATGGYVLPRNFSLRIEPEKAELRLAEVLRVKVDILDEQGKIIPEIPFSVFTPEFYAHGNTNSKPLFDMYSQQHVHNVAEFVAERLGETVLTVEAAGKNGKVSVHIVDGPPG